MSIKMRDVIDAIDHRGRTVHDGEMGLWVRASEWDLVRESMRHSSGEADQRSPLAVAEALGTVFCNMDADGDPVGAQPETDWEKGYAAGLRHVYRVLKQRGFVLPAACSAVSEGSK